ncbi:hypothetical protein PJP10_18345 [Mycobacterium kansasii]
MIRAADIVAAQGNNLPPTAKQLHPVCGTGSGTVTDGIVCARPATAIRILINEPARARARARSI